MCPGSSTAALQPRVPGPSQSQICIDVWASGWLGGFSFQKGEEMLVEFHVPYSQLSQSWLQKSACPRQVWKTPTCVTIFLCVHPPVFTLFPCSHLVLTFDIFYWFSLKIGFIFCPCKSILSVVTDNPLSKLPIDVLFLPRQDKFDNPL